LAVVSERRSVIIFIAMSIVLFKEESADVSKIILPHLHFPASTMMQTRANPPVQFPKITNTEINEKEMSKPNFRVLSLNSALGVTSS